MKKESGAPTASKLQVHPTPVNIETSQCSTSDYNTSSKNPSNQVSGRGGIPHSPPHNTSQDSPAYSEQKPSAETRALHLLKASGFQYIQQLDNVCQDEAGNWVVFEIKDKELFTPGSNFPHYGAGLDRSQLFLRNQLFKVLGLRTFLLVFVKGTQDVYGQWLDILEQGVFYDTPKKIRIYPIDNFTKLVSCP